MGLDWNLAASNAYKNTELVNEMMNDENINPHVFSIHNIDDCLKKLKDLTKGVTRLIPITPHNLTEVFSYFEKNVLAKHSLNTNQLANLFTQILINPDDNYLHPVKKRKTIVTKSFNEVDTDPDISSGNGPLFWRRGYIELEASSGTGLGCCAFLFNDAYGNRLRVCTAGEELPRRKAYATVTNFEFVSD